MEKLKKTPLSRILSLLLAICIAAGFVPLIDYSAFAVDNETTIGVLEDNTPRSGNGWKWDGKGTLTLYGTELKSKDDSTPKISYSGETLTINVKGYNRVTGNSLLAEVDEWKKINITGSGILESDSTEALFSGFIVTVDGTLIKAPKAKFFDGTKSLDHKSGYLEIGTLNGSVTMTSGVINCNMLSSGSITQNGGVFYVETLNAGKPITCNKGAIFKVNTIPAGADYSITCNNGSIVISGVDIKGKVSGQTGKTVDNLYVYCGSVVDASIDQVYDDTNLSMGVYYTAPSVDIGNNVTFSGAVYFAGSAEAKKNSNFTVAEGATVAGDEFGGLGAYKPTIGASSTMCFNKNLWLQDTTVNGSVYGCLTYGTNQGTTLQNSTIGATGSVYTLNNSSTFWDCTIDGSVTVYGTAGTPISLNSNNSNTKVNGKINLYSTYQSDLVSIGGWTFGKSAELAGYTSAGQIFDDPNDSKAFDTAIGSRAFYTAKNLGDEFTATVSGANENCGKVIYIGNEYEKRLDTAFGYSPWIYDGHFRTYKSLLLSLDPEDSQKAFLAYNSTCDIDNLNDVKVTITKGSKDCTTGFAIKRSHYYYTDESNPNNAIARSVGIEIGATKGYALTAGDEYEVTVEYGDYKHKETIEVTGVATTLNFTGKLDTAHQIWFYDGVTFEKPDTDYEANTWAWYAKANTELGYPAKTLVLNGIDLASSNFNAVIVPDGTTIILKGENKLYATTSAIRCNGSLTIIGEKDSSLTAISNELAPNNTDVKSFDAVIKTYGNVNNTYTLLIKNATLNLKAKKTAEVGGSNNGCTNCYGISSDNVIIENSDITAYAGHPGQDSLKSAAIRARDNIIIRGNTTLSLDSEQYALYAGKIKSIELSKLQGADVTLDNFNSSLKNNGNVYNKLSIESKSVSLATKPIEQLDEAKTADVLDPEDGKQTLSLSDLFSGGTGSYVFALADGVTLPSWITLAENGTLTINTPNEEYAGDKYMLTVMDEDADLRTTDPFEFTLTVGKIGRSVMLTVDYDNALGTVKPKTGKVLAGEDTVVEVKANDGAYIESVTLDGAPVELTATEKTSVGRITSGTYTIEKIDSNHTVNVTFKEIPTYKVSVTKNDGGTVKVETAALADYTYTEGTDVVISVLADDGYVIKSITLGGETITLTDGKFTIKGIKANCEFAVEFVEMPTYTVTVTANNGGTVTVETAALTGKPNTYAEGTDVVISAVADSGYRIKSIMLGGAAVTLTDGKYTIKSIAANYTFAVEFEEIPTYTVTVTANNGGTVTVETAALTGKPNTYAEGTDVVISAVADSGYRIKSIMLGGAAVTLTDGKYTIKSIAANYTFAVEFETIPTYAVTVNCGEHGAYTTDYTGELTAVREGTAIKFTVTPESGYALKEALVNGVKARVTSRSFTVIVTGATEVSLTFAKSSGGGSSSGRPNRPNSNNSSSDSSKTLPQIENNTGVNGWDSIADYIKSNSSSLKGKTLSIVLNDYANIPENVLEAAKAAGCTLRLITSGGSSITVDPAQSTAGINAAVNVSSSYSNITIGSSTVPAFTITTGAGGSITVALGSEFGGKTATLMRYGGGRYVGIGAAPADKSGSVTFDMNGFGGGTYYIAVDSRNYLENDVNGDNKVDIKDASFVLKQAFGVLTDAEQGGLYFDNAIINTKPTIEDANRILKSCFGVN